jgi:hypothetical protein
MTSIFIDPAQFGPPTEPEPAEQLIVNGRYYLPPVGDPTGKRRSLQRVTNFVKQISDTEGLTKWKLRMTVIGLARDERRYDLATSLTPDSKSELDKLIEECIDLGQAGPSGGNITGTALHNYTDDLPGRYPIRVRDKWVPKVENYQRALHDHGLRVVPGLTERLVVSERYGTAGRLDDVYEDVHGSLFVADRKSQKEFYTWFEIASQLALYQCSDAMFDEATHSFVDMPVLNPDHAIVAWMPLTHPGPRPDEVELYRLPLAPARKLLDIMAEVRDLRSGARKWGEKMGSLPRWERNARDIRDAETLDDLRDLFAERAVPGAWDIRLDDRAAARWEELAAAEAEKDAPASTPLVPGVNVQQVSAYVGPTVVAPNVRTEVAPGVEVTHQGPGNVAMTAQANGQVTGYMNSGINFNGDIAFDPALFVAPEQDATFLDAAEISGGPGAGTDDGGPALTAQTHPIATTRFTHSRHEDAVVVELPNRDPDCQRCNYDTHRCGGCGTPLAHGTEVCAPCDEQEPRSEELRKPVEWMAHLGYPELFSIPADPDGVWCKPMPLKTFKSLYPYPASRSAVPLSTDELRRPIDWAAEFGVVIRDPSGWHGGPGRFVAKDLEEPITRSEFQARMSSSAIETSDGVDVRKPRAWAEHLDLDSVVAAGLPDVFMTRAEFDVHRTEGPIRTPSSTDDRATAIEALDSVPIKIVREVCTRANNSHSSRGRVRLLNDVESNKYAAHGVELMPALLAEWLAVDGGPVAGDTYVANTGGSKRPAMEVAQAGKITLTEYLALKDSAAQADYVEQSTREEVGHPHIAATHDPARNPALAAKVQEFAADVAEIRKPYLGLTEGPNAGKHSIARLVELACQAENGAERAKVFHEITRREAWTQAIADEINAAYRERALPGVDFSGYFQATALPSSSVVEVGTMSAEDFADEAPGPLPADPDDPATAEDAIHLLEGITTLAELQRIWAALGTKSYFHEQTLQEALMSRFTKVKA